MTEQTTALTVVQRAVVAIGITAEREKELRDLAARTNGINAITNKDGYQQVHSGRMALKNERVSIQNLAKEARDEATKFSRAVIAEEKRIIGLIEPEEQRLQKLQDAWDAAIEAEKQAKIAAEQKRVADLQERVAILSGNRIQLSPSTDPELIADYIADIEGIVVDNSYEEFRQQAEEAKTAGLARLREFHKAAVAHQAEQARIKAEREELARLRAEEEKRQAAERARLAEEERQAKAARDAEAAKQAAELKAAREKQEAEAAAERKRIADEEAAAKAIRDAEAAKQAEELRVLREAQAKADAEVTKLAEERAEFERQRAGHIESLSGGNPSEKSASGPADDRGIAAARSSEGGNGEQALDVMIQSREPVDSNPVSVVRASPEQIHAKDVDPAPSVIYAVASIKKPADDELLGVLAKHYNVPATKVVEWILAMDLSKDIAA